MVLIVPTHPHAKIPNFRTVCATTTCRALVSRLPGNGFTSVRVRSMGSVRKVRVFEFIASTFRVKESYNLIPEAKIKEC